MSQFTLSCWSNHVSILYRFWDVRQTSVSTESQPVDDECHCATHQATLWLTADCIVCVNSCAASGSGQSVPVQWWNVQRTAGVQELQAGERAVYLRAESAAWRHWSQSECRRSRYQTSSEPHLYAPFNFINLTFAKRQLANRSADHTNDAVQPHLSISPGSHGSGG